VSGEGPAFAAPPPPHESAYSGDLELEDLVFSWRRVTDPKLRKIALDLIRSMAS
jgi:hypothetical protein